MIRRESKYKQGVYWWGCSGYPNCTVTAAEHPDGSVMSSPADFKIKALRMSAHRIAEDIWGAWDDPLTDKRGMYAWLAKNTRTGHIGTLNHAELERLIEKLLRLVEKMNK